MPEERTLGAPSKTSAVLSVLNITELTQQDGREKRTAKRLCVTNVTGLLLVCDKRDRAITCMFSYRNLHLTIVLTGLLQKDLKKDEV